MATNQVYTPFQTVIKSDWLNFTNQTVNMFVSPMQYGAKGDGVTDDTAAVQAAFNAVQAKGSGAVWFPAGIFILSAAIIFNFPQQRSALSVYGMGQDVTELRWAAGTNGLVLNLISPGNSFHIRDASFTTKGAGGGFTGILASSSSSLNTFMNNDISNCGFRGADNVGAGGFMFWGNCWWMNGVCGTNVANPTCYGGIAAGGAIGGLGGLYTGNLAYVTGPSGFGGYSIYHNIYGGIFNGLSTGVEYGSYAQGLTINQCNMQNTTTGVYTPPGATGLLSQLQVANSQLACFGNNIFINTNIGNIMVVNNDIFSHGGNSGVFIVSPEGYSITGNNIAADGTSNCIGVAIGAPYVPGQQGTVVGNVFTGLNVGVLLQAGSSGNNIQSNVYPGCNTQVSNLGSGNTIGGGSA